MFVVSLTYPMRILIREKLGSGNSTRCWVLTPSCEMKFSHLCHQWGQTFQRNYIVGRVLVSLPPHGVTTTQTDFILQLSSSLHLPKFLGKKPKVTIKVTFWAITKRIFKVSYCLKVHTAPLTPPSPILG